MFCTNCGKKLEEGWKVCPSCGAPVEGSNQEEKIEERDTFFNEPNENLGQNDCNNTNANGNNNPYGNNPYANGNNNSYGNNPYANENNNSYGNNPYANGNNYESQNQPTESNGLAIAGFVCAFFFPLLGFIFGIIGLNKSKKLNGTGKGLAIAAIVISVVVWIISMRVTLNYIQQIVNELESSSASLFFSTIK